jgi:hypothetical protein
MAVCIVAGKEIDGVIFDTATGREHNGYVAGSTPIHPMLLVDQQNPATLVGVKYSHHEADVGGGDREPDGYVRMTMLVQGGPWRQRLWRQNPEESVEVLLLEPGDLIAWEPGLYHSWTPLGSSTMLTVSIIRDAANNPIEAGQQRGSAQQRVASEPTSR